MGKLRVFSGHEMCRLLETNGFVTVRQAGSHRILQRRGEVGTITIPVPMHSELRRGTLLSIVR
ncbi:MAG: hypothetical protein RL328_738, partial [Acidobacteriota bacterium]